MNTVSSCPLDGQPAASNTSRRYRLILPAVTFPLGAMACNSEAGPGTSYTAIVGLLSIVAVLFWCCVRVMRRRAQLLGEGSADLSLRGELRVGAGRRLLVVRWRDRDLLLSDTAQGLALLTDDRVGWDGEPEAKPATTGTFASILAADEGVDGAQRSSSNVAHRQDTELKAGDWHA